MQSIDSKRRVKCIYGLRYYFHYFCINFRNKYNNISETNLYKASPSIHAIPDCIIMGLWEFDSKDAIITLKFSQRAELQQKGHPSFQSV